MNGRSRFLGTTVTELVFSGDSLALLGWTKGLTIEDFARILSDKFHCDVVRVDARPAYLLGSLLGDVAGPYFRGQTPEGYVIEVGTNAVTLYSQAAFESGP
jgi:hypothetical protein